MKTYQILLGVLLVFGACMAIVLWRLPATVARATTRKVVSSKGQFVLGLRDNGTVFCVNALHTVCASLPANLNDAILAMEKSELVRETLGEHVFEYFLRNKRAEWQEYSNQVTAYELDRYLPVL